MEDNRKTLFISILLFLSLFTIVEFSTQPLPAAKAATIQVGPGQTYLTIQEGIDAANPGDTVFVHEGIYFEFITINKTINLTGENRETTIIDGMGASEVVFIEADYVNMTGFTVTNGDHSIWINPSNYSKIEGNIIHNTSWLEYSIVDAGFGDIFSENFIYNVYMGIFFSFLSRNGKASNNYIYSSAGGIGIDGNNITISNNELHNISFSGIQISGSYNELVNNSIHNLGGVGIFVYNPDTINNTIINNTINNAEYGIRISASSRNNTFTDCFINNSSEAGIFIDLGSQNSMFINCSISNSLNADAIISKSNAIFLNTTFDKFKVQLSDNTSSLTVKWYMDVFAKDVAGNPIPNANVQIFNKINDHMATRTTDEEGFLRWIVVTERIQNDTTNITHTPHNITASKDSYVGYAIPEPVMDGSRQVNVTIGIPLHLHHIEIEPSGPESYYIGDNTIYTAIGWNDAAETQMNLTWTPVWNVDNGSLAAIDSGTGFFTANALGSSAVNVTSASPTGIYATSPFTVDPWPLHHVMIVPVGPETYYIGDVQNYTAIGWNDATETQMNTTWTPMWSVDNISVASVNETTGVFTALAVGSGSVNVTGTALPWVYSTSAFTVESWPLHHIKIVPAGPETYYIRDQRTYSAVGWNDAEETQQNLSWMPQWNVDNTSIAKIAGDTGSLSAEALGEGVVNVTSAYPTGIFTTSSFTVDPWPLHHITITPSGPESYYLGDTQTYTAVGWNDAQETQMNTSWIPVWNVNDSSIASIDSASGEFTALALGSSDVKVSASSLPGISNSSFFTVDPWSLHHIEIIPGGSGNYYIGDTHSYSVIGWNDAQETQINTSWIPVWRVENTSFASINETGFFTAISLGNSEINVSSSLQPWIHSNSTFSIHPWPLHHLSILPSDPQIFTIGDMYSYIVIGWNDAQETQMNITWTPVWSLKGNLEEFTWEGEEARFEVKKSGEGTLNCEDEATGINASTEIIVRKEPEDANPVWVWIITAVILIVVIIMLLLIFRKNKKDKDNSE